MNECLGITNSFMLKQTVETAAAVAAAAARAAVL